MIKDITAKSIKQLQNQKITYYEVSCSKCGKVNFIQEKDRLKYSPKNYYKGCVNCREPIEGEWKKLIK